MKPRVHLTIDRVVLHGVSRRQRDECARTIEAELAARLSDAQFVRSLRSANLASARVDTRAATDGTHSPATQIAAAVLTAVRGGG